MSGALVLWRDGTVRPAQSSAALALLKCHHRRLRPAGLSLPRQPTCATSALPSVTNIERNAANGRSAATGALKRNVEHDALLVELVEPQALRCRRARNSR